MIQLWTIEIGLPPTQQCIRCGSPFCPDAPKEQSAPESSEAAEYHRWLREQD